MSFDGQTPGVYSAPQDAVLNPPYCASLVSKLASGAPDTQILPPPPAGKLWVVFNANVVVEGAGTPSWALREVVAGEPVRTVDQRAGTTPGQYFQIGGIALAGALNFENTGATFVTYYATVCALPAGLVQRFWLSLTDVFQAVPIVHGPDVVQRVPFCGFSALSNAQLWMLNTNATARSLELRFTRGSDVVVIPTSAAMAANVRGTIGGAAGACAFPPLLAGDVLEARVTVAPLTPVYLGGLLQAVPLVSLT